MKRVGFLIIVGFILFFSFFLGDYLLQEEGLVKVEAEIEPLNPSDNSFAQINPKPKSNIGKLSIKLVSEFDQHPLANVTLQITNTINDKVLEIITDKNGRAITPVLRRGIAYHITAKDLPQPFKKEEPFAVILKENHEKIILEAKLPTHIVKVQQTASDTFLTKEVQIPVATLMQKPELPNGCEITSLTAVLNYFGYPVSKTNMSRDFLTKIPFTRKENKLFGADPYKAFAGDPSHSSGFFVYAPPIVKAANSYLANVKSSLQGVDISGSSHEDIIKYLNQGIPVVMWVTLDLSPPKITYSWFLHDTGKKFDAPVNLHAVVLSGYTDSDVYVMDPLQGQITRNKGDFFRSYDALGKHAMIVKEN